MRQSRDSSLLGQDRGPHERLHSYRTHFGMPCQGWRWPEFRGEEYE